MNYLNHRIGIPKFLNTEGPLQWVSKNAAHTNVQNWNYLDGLPINHQNVFLKETDENILAVMEITGVDKEDIRIETTVTDGYSTVIVTADRPETSPLGGKSYSYYFSVKNHSFDVNKAKAELKNGILTINIPKIKIDPKIIKVT